MQSNTHFSIENPADSYLFLYEPIVRLLQDPRTQLITFDQCAYGLRPPGASMFEFTRKRTSLLTSMPELHALQRACPGLTTNHIHVHAWGSVKVDGVSYSRARAAGAYPLQLCTAWAQCICRHVQTNSRQSQP